MLRCCLIFAEIRDVAAEEELACDFAILFTQRGFHFRRHVDCLFSGMLGYSRQEKEIDLVSKPHGINLVKIIYPESKLKGISCVVYSNPAKQAIEVT